MIIVGLCIYIFSVLGATLYIRYDDEFEADEAILVIVFCPPLNTIISVYEVVKLLIYIDTRFMFKINKNFLKLIKYNRKK